LEHCNNAVDYFQKLGYELIDVEIPLLPEGQLAQAYSILTEMSFTAKQNPVPNSNYLTAINPAEKILLATGAQTSAYDYLLAQSLRNLLMQHLAFLYQQHPGLIILTPTTPMAGWPINNPGDLTHGVSDANTSLRNMTYVWLANFCGNPAISVPVGYVDPVKGKGKIPIGLMAMGEWGAEEQLLQWGSEAETYLNDVYGGRIRAENWEDVVKAAKSTK
jgi:Asp-tRNA(Asn)/Glu-tRNA(Gln) amidotransferase A subunit family amidase